MEEIKTNLETPTTTEQVVTQGSERSQILMNSKPTDSLVQTEPVSADTSDTTITSEEQRTNDGTENKTVEPEFTDPNMQKKFTQRMQELSAKEKQYNESIKFAEYYKQLKADEGALKILQKYYSGEKSEPEQKQQEQFKISQEDILIALENPDKFQQIIEQIADRRAEEKLTEIKTVTTQSRKQLQEMTFLQDIEEFANAKDENGVLLHPDYEELESSGKIEEYLPLVSNSLPSIQKIELAYKLAKTENQNKEVIDKAHKIVEQKKKSISEKGNSTTSNVIPKFKNRDEFITWQSKQLGLNEIP